MFRPISIADMDAINALAEGIQAEAVKKIVAVADIKTLADLELWLKKNVGRVKYNDGYRYFDLPKSLDFWKTEKKFLAAGWKEKGTDINSPEDTLSSSSRVKLTNGVVDIVLSQSSTKFSNSNTVEVVKVESPA